MTNSWFRSWHGAPTDPKWLAIAQRTQTNAGTVSAVFWALMDHASQAEDRGDVSGFDVEAYAAFSGFDETKVTSIIGALKSKNIIEDNKLTAWEKRQPKREDGSAERAKEWRERKRTQANAKKHRLDTDTDTDTERKEDTAKAVLKPKYFFESGVIRLIEKDFRNWEEAFTNLELRAELIALTEWAGSQTKWFHAVAGALAKRNREIRIRKTSPPPPKVLSPFGTEYPDGII